MTIDGTASLALWLAIVGPKVSLYIWWKHRQRRSQCRPNG